MFTSPEGRGRIASTDAIRVRAYGPTESRGPSPGLLRRAIARQSNPTSPRWGEVGTDALRRAGDLSVSLLHCASEAATRVRSHISPGPYRSFRELSLAGPVGPDIWCPPTFVGNSGIECFNGIRGFALFLLLVRACRNCVPDTLAVQLSLGVMPCLARNGALERASGTPRRRGSCTGVSAISDRPHRG